MADNTTIPVVARNKRPRGTVIPVARECPECGTVFVLKDYDPRKYCSKKCAEIGVGKQKRGDKHHGWRGGKSSKARPGTITSFTTRQVKVGSACAECGSKDDLQAHHIKRYADHPELAMDEANIQILCATHHAAKHPESAHLLLKKKTTLAVYECAKCGTPFRAKSRKRRKRYCSQNCYYSDPVRPVRGGDLGSHGPTC